MQRRKKFGLIGKNISYSFSKNYFEKKFQKGKQEGHSYELFDIDEIEGINQIFKDPDLIGLNVTIPYKEVVIPFLNILSEEAQKIGAVNCISVLNGIKTGYNTDVTGFRKTLLLHKKPVHKSALILGNGGAAKAVRYVLDEQGISHQTVSRSGALNFQDVPSEEVSRNLLIIQSTPVGTFPAIEDHLPFPFEALTADHLVIDLIYNPEWTAFLKIAANHGATTVNGLFMLEQQAEKSWEIWNVPEK